MPFLAGHDDARDLRDAAPTGLEPEALFVGQGAMGLEIAQFIATRRPAALQLRELHERRRERRATPVLVVVTYGDDRASIATRFGEEWLVRLDLDRAQIERLCEAALEAPDRHTADALLRAKLSQLDQPVPGLRNAGLFAMHELEHGVPARPDWEFARTSARALLPLRGRELVERLGYAVEATTGP